MGVDLCRGQAGVAEHLLDRPQIGTSLEQMRSRAVPQTVRPDVRGVRDVLQETVDHGADLTWVHPPTSSTQKQCWAAASGHDMTATELQPSLQGGGRRPAERDRPLLGSLAHDTDQAGAEVDVVDVHAHQLPDPDPRGIQQLQHRSVSQMSLIHISEPTRRTPISYAVFCLKKKKKKN